MRFDPEEVKKLAKDDFERAWVDGKRYVARMDLNESFPRFSFNFGKSHPVFDTIQRLRTAYINLGFEETINPMIVEDSHIYRQFGKEAMAVLDRCFYLAGLPHANVGISSERISKMEELFGRELSAEEVETVRKIFHMLKKGEIEGDDIIAEISASLHISDSRVASVFDEVFPEFRDLIPLPTKLTLRSHMTSGWFITLASLWDRHIFPIKLFSIDRCFRREQQEDPTRLMNYFSASCVLMDEELSLDHGKAVAVGLLSQFGFEDFKFMPDEKRSKYYVPETQTEIFAYHPKLVDSTTKYSDGWVEVATFGIYSPSALAQYDIPYPVMNLGLGVERLAMILYDSSDLRALSYPQFHSAWELSDFDLAKLVSIKEKPLTEEGREIADAIVNTCELEADVPSPCEFDAWEGDLTGRKINVKVVEPEENTKLCGPAYKNEIVVYNGDILGLPRIDKWKKVFEGGVSTGIRFVDAFAYLAARNIEVSAAKGEDCEERVRIVKVPGEINIAIHPVAHRHITDNNKKIDIRGPVFTMVKMEVLK
ncbi:MAG: O-phosphoserine--tRNA ligase [Halobacteriota archaeon]|nr:O-phosphoserine--tRNA ligase [Halobacteriota archaeon]